MNILHILFQSAGGETTFEYTDPSQQPDLIQAEQGQLSLSNDVAGLLHNMAAQVQQQQYGDGVSADLQNLMQNVIVSADNAFLISLFFRKSQKIINSLCI